MAHRARVNRRALRPNVRAEAALASVWAVRTMALELFAANKMTPAEITQSYEATFPAVLTRCQILRAVANTQGVVVQQTARALNISPEDIRERTGQMPVDEAVVTEIELGLNRMLVTWQLDYSRLLIEPEFRGDQVTVLLAIARAGTTHEALVLLALEAIRKPAFGADAAASLVSQPPTAAELAEAEFIADLAELALSDPNPTQPMLDAVDLLTERPVQQPTQRRKRATNTQARLARRTVTQTQGTSAKEVQTSLGIDGYQWVSQRDGRVRPLHRQLDAESRAGKVFTWSNPDTRGEGNPGDPYGCRCVAVPVIAGATPFVPAVARRVAP